MRNSKFVKSIGGDLRGVRSSKRLFPKQPHLVSTQLGIMHYRKHWIKDKLEVGCVPERSIPLVEKVNTSRESAYVHASYILFPLSLSYTHAFLLLFIPHHFSRTFPPFPNPLRTLLIFPRQLKPLHPACNPIIQNHWIQPRSLLLITFLPL